MERQDQDGLAPSEIRIDGRIRRAGDRLIPLALSPFPRISWRPSPGPPHDEVEVVIDSGGTVVVREHTKTSDPWLQVSTALPELQEFSVSVRVRSFGAEWSPASPGTLFERGPDSFASWNAEWITAPSPIALRRAFVVEAQPRSARLHLTAQGLVHATVNGHPINGDASDPSRTDPQRALYRTYDISDLIVEGENHLDLDLGLGEVARIGISPRVLAMVALTDRRDLVRKIGTSEEMSAAESVVIADEPFYREAHDYTIRPSFATNSSVRAVQGDEALGLPLPLLVEPDPGPPIRCVERVKATEITRPLGHGNPRTYDVGTNIAGRSRVLLLHGVPAGTTVRVIHGEHLDVAGHVDTTNITMPFDDGRMRQVMEYTVAGTSGEILTPRFSYHGFRYLEVLGLPPECSVEVSADTFHSDVAAIAHLETDAPLFDELHRRTARTFANNVHGLPEDCPTREQSGWTGDAASAIDFSFAAFDTESLFRKWLGDVATSQGVDGSIPAIVPDLRPLPAECDPVWGAALQNVLEAHWLHYGDRAVLDNHLPALRRWADYLLSCVDGRGIITNAAISYGHDWLALTQTPPELLHTAAVQDALATLARLERSVEHTEAAASRELQVLRLQAAARSAFVADHDERLRIGNGSQASLASALEYGWLRGAEVPRATDMLVGDVRRRGDRLSSGFAATRTVVRALARNGESQVLADALHQPDQPGIGAMIAHGPGTLWECWWIDPSNTGTGSLNHVGLGGPVAGWLWRSLVGLRPTAAGYSEYVIEPHWVRQLGRLEASVDTVRGEIRVQYHHTSARTTVTIDAPSDCSGRLCLPDGSDHEIMPGRNTFEVVPPSHQAAPIELSPPPPFEFPLPLGAHTEAKGAVESFEILPHGLRCMPVPHEQPAGHAVAISGAPLADGTLTVLASAHAGALDIRSVSAFLDFCSSTRAKPREALLRVTLVDGTVHEGRHRIWPAGWQRVTCVLPAGNGSVEIATVEIGARFDTDDLALGEPAGFVIGAVRWSPFLPTWE